MNEINSKNFRELIRVLERKLELLNKQDGCCSEVTLAQCHALVEIGRIQSISLKELANILDLDISTMSRTVDTLVKKELAFRTQSEIDRRSIVIKLTDKGYSLFNDIENKMNNEFKKIFEYISEENQLMVFNGLNIIIKAFTKSHNLNNISHTDSNCTCSK